MMLLECQSLSKHFGGLKAVDDVSFSVEAGEVFCIIGPNGAGKTTIFNLLTGFLKPTAGTAMFEGQEILGRKPYEIATQGLTRTYQHTSVFPDLTVLENARIGYHRKQVGTIFDSLLRTPTWRHDEQAATDKAYEELEFLGLADEAGNLAKNLAYGKQRLLEIAIALCLEPDLLLLDEPAAGMNPEETTTLMQTIRTIRERGITILLVEHNMRLVMGISDRILAIDHGRELICGKPDEVSNDPGVIEAYLGGGVYA